MALGRKTGGRKAGRPNKASADMVAFCKGLIEDPEYRTYFEHRLKVGQLQPALEAMMWHYAYGKPVERQEHSGPNGGALVWTWQLPQ